MYYIIVVIVVPKNGGTSRVMYVSDIYGALGDHISV